MAVDQPAALILAFSCADRPGIVAAVSSAVFTNGWSIRESQQFEDGTRGRFFSRIEFSPVDESADLDAVRAALVALLESWEAEFVLEPAHVRKRVLIMASKQDHCLADLLYRARTGDLAMDVVGVVSNHPREVYGNLNFGTVPFHHLPVDPADKRAQEIAVSKLIDELGIDLVILARYMQILSDEFAAELAGRCINIHHSFLPGFKGAKPYHQAYERGVKLIGATAHYVTGDLDEGPIISQDVEPISHRDLPAALVRKGRDIERRVLARAVRYHLADRVLVNGRTTVVFPD
ncbi:formyltetrahydrofolate deformylase [Streptomyces sp. NPDC057257]|uniref:formyltetrahydrofolate deformylase n=1 Tax=Streptomyces sp. NPDC057257 TaxID=3346071 RepID=UPI0036290CF1